MLLRLKNLVTLHRAVFSRLLHFLKLWHSSYSSTVSYSVLTFQNFVTYHKVFQNEPRFVFETRVHFYSINYCRKRMVFFPGQHIQPPPFLTEGRTVFSFLRDLEVGKKTIIQNWYLNKYKEKYIAVCGSITTFFLSRKITLFLSIFWITDTLTFDNQKKTHIPLLPCWVFIVEKLVFLVSHINSEFETARW